MVAVAGRRSAPVVVLRRRVELAGDDPGSKQPFHAAEGLDLNTAEDLIRRSTDVARTLARRALGGAVAEMKRAGHEVERDRRARDLAVVDGSDGLGVFDRREADVRHEAAG